MLKGRFVHSSLFDSRFMDEVNFIIFRAPGLNDLFPCHHDLFVSFYS